MEQRKDEDTIGARIKKIREFAELTQEEFAVRIGLDNHKTLAAYENGRRNPSRKILKRICEEFNVSLDYLVGTIHVDGRSEILYLINGSLNVFSDDELYCFYKRLRMEIEIYHKGNSSLDSGMQQQLPFQMMD